MELIAKVQKIESENKKLKQQLATVMPTSMKENSMDLNSSLLSTITPQRKRIPLTVTTTTNLNKTLH